MRELILRRIRKLSDTELTATLIGAAAGEREDLFSLLLRLSEVDRRRPASIKGFPSAFEYCTRILGYSESAATRRIAVARK